MDRSVLFDVGQVISKVLRIKILTIPSKNYTEETLNSQHTVQQVLLMHILQVIPVQVVY